MKEQKPEPFSAKKESSSKSLQEEVLLTFGRAISNLTDAENSVVGKASEYLAGIRQNIEGAAAFLSSPRRLVNASLEIALVSSLAQACAPRTINAEDIKAATSAITEQYNPPANEETKIPTIEMIKTANVRPTPSATPEPTATAEPTVSPIPMEINSDGNYVPRQEAFADTGEGAIKEIKDVDPFPFLDKIFEQVKNKLSITNDDDLENASFIIVCEKSNRLYTIVRNKIDSKAYAVFMKNKDGQYISLVPNGELVLLPMKTEIKDDKELTGFDVQGNLLIPPTFTYSSKNGEIVYTDPITGEQIVIKKESNTAPKMLALLKASEVSISPEQILTDEQQIKKVDIESQLLLLGLPTDSYTLKFDGDDVLIEEKSGDRVWYTDGLNFSYAVENLKQNADLSKVIDKPKITAGIITETNELFGKYILPLKEKMVEQYNAQHPDSMIPKEPEKLEQYMSICINPDTNSWGVVIRYNGITYLVFERKSGEVNWVKVQKTDNKTIAFYTKVGK